MIIKLNKNTNLMQSITSHTTAIRNAQADILGLQEKIKSLKENIINDLTQEFASELQQVKDAILQAFPKAKVNPKTLGFTVKSSAFKNCDVTDVRNAINENLKPFGMSIKVQGRDSYDSIHNYYRYKTIDINLTKEWMKKARPEYKNAILMIEC